MCGIAGIFGPGAGLDALSAMVAAQRHRGPDAEGLHLDREAGLGHARLSILDLSDAGRQPMRCPEGRFTIVFNGEIYNHVELREQLAGEHRFRTGTDTEVALAAFRRWGEGCLDRFLGMFAFLVWDAEERRLFAARDRFGVKPLHYALDPRGTLLLASEIKALHAAGVPRHPDPGAWAEWLARGASDRGPRTFWAGVSSLPAGHTLRFSGGALSVSRWYDLHGRIGDEIDGRAEAEVAEEFRALLEESVALRFRSDVPVGFCLSGGLDSSLLLGLVRRVPAGGEVPAFTFACGDPAYDETPFAAEMLRGAAHRWTVATLSPGDVPRLAESMARHQDEPYGGLPTLAYGALFERAREEGVKVLLDGQGIDEAWGGYDYYAREGPAPVVQGARDPALRPDCLLPGIAESAGPCESRRPFPDALRNLQLRDLEATKIPRALRYNDRASMRASVELREPFLDHRLVELGLRQPPDRKIGGGVRKRLVRAVAARLCPGGVVEAPKRPLQTPQREWLRGPLRGWAEERIEEALEGPARAFLDRERVREATREFLRGRGDNSFFLWQWIGAGMMLRELEAPAEAAR
jgi:asparagine synthase (glutamine-hydrolysing)